MNYTFVIEAYVKVWSKSQLENFIMEILNQLEALIDKIVIVTTAIT